MKSLATMSSTNVVILICSISIFRAISVNPTVTFGNVTVNFYEENILHLTDFNDTLKIINLVNSNSLSGYYPKGAFSTAIVKGSVPFLYKDAISYNQHLESLCLYETGIKGIKQGAFRNLPKLRHLLLNDNKLTRIKGGIFNDLKVVELYLDKNEIRHISTHAFDNMTQLRKIYLYYNKLSYWDSNWFNNCPNLKIFGFNNNQIEGLPEKAFKNLKDENKVEIYLEYNRMKKISRNLFGNLTNVEKFLLNSNEIVDWDEYALDGIVVNFLDVSDNKIRRLIGNLENYFVARYSDVDNNPWDCKCLEKIAELSLSKKFVREKVVLMETALENCHILIN